MSDLESRTGLVLAGFLPSSVERLSRALTIPEDAFRDPIERFILDASRAYFNAYRQVMPAQVLQRRLEQEDDEGLRLDIARRFIVLRDLDVPDDQFEWACSSVFEDFREREAIATYSAAYEAITSGTKVKRRNRFVVVRGYEASREVLAEGLRRLDSFDVGSVPEGELAHEYEDLLADVGNERSQARKFLTGFPSVDRVTAGGIAPGELWFVAAYAGEGKTTFAINLAREAVLQGKNVVYLTGETMRDEVRRRFVVRHTRAPQFGDPSGVSALGVKTGGLSPEKLSLYQAAARDLVDGMNSGSYGRFLIRQMPLQNTFDDVLSSLDRFEQAWPVDVLVVDSVDMVRTERSVSWSYREQLSDTIERFASLAVGFQNGRGLAIVSPYQIKRDAYESALSTGRYELSALSETAMAERRAYAVLSLLRLPSDPSHVRMQVLKNRGGPVCEGLLDLQLDGSFIGEVPRVAPRGISELI